MVPNNEIKVAVMQEQISYIKQQVDAIVTKLDNNYTTIDEHNALKEQVIKLESNQNKIAWLIISSVVVALIALVVTVK